MTSLFIQSPFGELPTGYRSSHHIWNEAQQVTVFEIYASAYAEAGMALEAGIFKRAARLSLASIRNWIRPDGSGYVVKNRYPIEAKHGYEKYTAHTCYNLTATSMLAQAYQVANDDIEEQPCPAEVGGFAFETPAFHKVYANAGGNYLQYDTSGDQNYNPTGILRIHLKNGHPQLGPSDGVAPKFSGEDVHLAVGPSWRINGEWQTLADSEEPPHKVLVIEENPERVRLRIFYEDVIQGITIDPGGVTVEDRFTHTNLEAIRVDCPMLVFDGKEETSISMDADSVRLGLSGKSIRFSVVQPKGLTLQRSGRPLKHPNGIVEAAFVETPRRRLVYRITAD
jgi:hypothetical protein